PNLVAKRSPSFTTGNSLGSGHAETATDDYRTASVAQPLQTRRNALPQSLADHAFNGVRPQEGRPARYKNPDLRPHADRRIERLMQSRDEPVRHWDAPMARFRFLVSE